MYEEWKAIQDYPNYAVSNLGRVKRVTPGRGARAEVVLTPRNTHKGYVRVALTNEKGRKDKQIHILVAQAFLPPPPDRHQVNHMDGIKCNNIATNLEWMTPKQNMRHAVEMGLFPILQGSRNPKAKLTEQDVALILSLQHKVTRDELAKRFNVCSGTISSIFEGQTWKHVHAASSSEYEKEIVLCSFCSEPMGKLRQGRPVKYCSDECMEQARKQQYRNYYYKKRA